VEIALLGSADDRHTNGLANRSDGGGPVLH